MDQAYICKAKYIQSFWCIIYLVHIITKYLTSKVYISYNHVILYSIYLVRNVTGIHVATTLQH